MNETWQQINAQSTGDSSFSNHPGFSITQSSEELKKEWAREFEQEFGIHFTPSELQFAKYFISSLLAKQQEEFVKCIPEEKKVEHLLKCKMCSPECGYNQCIADIKNKIK
jgi:hypothetical protein